MIGGVTKVEKLQFSGHESFACKQFWLKKGFDFALEKKSFNDESAVVHLGVGKNMVNSIRYWCRAFNILNDKDEPTKFGKAIFSNEGYDPYLEDIGTLWLLHYSLSKKNKASIYSLFFNEFRKERQDFTKEHFHLFLKRKCNEVSFIYNENTITSDLNVFLKNYIHPETQGKIEIEDAFANMFLDLNIFDKYKKKNLENFTEEWYKLEDENREDLPIEIILFAILDTFDGSTSLTFRQVLAGLNSPGSIFLLDSNGLHKKILQITEKFNDIVFSETAGNQIIQIKTDINKWEVLNEYYN
jgi:hypothetical protein